MGTTRELLDEKELVATWSSEGLIGWVSPGGVAEVSTESDLLTTAPDLIYSFGRADIGCPGPRGKWGLIRWTGQTDFLSEKPCGLG